MIDLLKGYFKIGDRDDHREMRAKVLGRVLGLDRALEPLLPPLLALLDVPVEDPGWQTLDPPQRRQRTLDAVKRLLLRESQVQPLLVVFEDLHWIDGETQALLDSLVESLGSARLLLLVNYRPEYEHRWGSKTAYSQLRLDSLPAESAAELLAALLGPDPGVTPLAQMLVKRGNPFFLEETVRTLVETRGAGGGARGVPSDATGGGAAGAGHGADDPGGADRPAAGGGEAAPAGGLGDRQGRALRAPGGDRRAAGGGAAAGARASAGGGVPLRDAALPGSGIHLQARAHARGDLQRAAAGPAARAPCAGRRGHRDAAPRSSRRADRAPRPSRRPGRVAGEGSDAISGRRASRRSRARRIPDALIWFEQALGVLASLPESPSTLEQAFDIRLELRLVFTRIAEARRALESLIEAKTLAERLNDDRRRGGVYAFMTNAHIVAR